MSPPPAAPRSVPHRHTIVGSLKKLFKVRISRSMPRARRRLLNCIAGSLFLEKWPRIAIEQLVGRGRLGSENRSVQRRGSEIRSLTLSSLRRGVVDCYDANPVSMTATDAEPFLVRSRGLFWYAGIGARISFGEPAWLKSVELG